jgi:hypothetical protein
MMRLDTDRLLTLLDDGQSQDALARQLNEHLDSLGCFIVRGCLEPMLVELVHASLEKLFSKAESEKAKYKVDKLKDPLGAGYSPYGVARAMDTGIPNLLETWDINASRDRWPEDMVEE